jgi:hypothetical protein
MGRPYAEPVEVARALLAAENAHDAGAAASLFAEDAVARASMDRFTTPDEIRRWQDFLAASDLHIEPGEFRQDGDRVQWGGTIAADFFRNLGLAELTGNWEIVVSSGKITSFTFSLSSEALAQVRSRSGGEGAGERMEAD